MTYINAVRLQAQYFTLLFSILSIIYTVEYGFGYIEEPLVLDMNFMAGILGAIVGIVFVSPFFNQSLD